MSDPFIVCNNLVKIYKVADHDVVALQGLDLVVETGELLGVVGVSGSGKSTLMNILGGLDRPSAGRIWANGKDLLKLSNIELDHYRLTTVGFVWQQASRNLVPYLSALKNVEMPLILAGDLSRTRRKQAEALLEAVGLSERRKHRLSELSGGEQQRVAIAVALANKPKLLLADEPTGEVDSANAATIYAIFRDLNRDLGLTTLIVSHDTGLAHHVDRVIAIRDGKISSETVRLPGTGSADELLAAHNGSSTGETQTDIVAEPVKVFQELTVLDSAGRLQVPKQYLERYQISGRARLEPVDDGILIRSAPDAAPAHDTEALVERMEEAKKSGAWQKVLRRFSKRR